MFKDLKQNACFDNSDLYRLIKYSMGKMKDNDIDKYLKKVRDQSNYFIYGYYESGNLVGLIIYKVENKIGNIDVISVEKDERGKGIGTKILNMINEKKQIVRIEAKCESKAVGFYKKLGFSVESIGKNYYEDEFYLCWIEYKSN